MSLVGTGTNPTTAAKYFGLALAVGLSLQAANSLLIKLAAPTVISGLRFVVFGLPAGISFMESLVLFPISEEVFFRGWLFGWFEKQNLSPVRIGGLQFSVSSLLTSLSFAVIHVASAGASFVWAKIIAVFIAGLVLAAARRKSGGLLIPILCHCLFNVAGIFFFTFV